MALQLRKNDPLLSGIQNVPQLTAGMGAPLPLNQPASPVPVNNPIMNVLRGAGSALYNLAVKPVVDTASSVGQNIGTNLASPSTIGTYEQAANAQTQQLNTLGALLKANKITKDQYNRAALGITQGNQITPGLQQTQAEADPLHTAGVAGNAALTIGSFGRLPKLFNRSLTNNLVTGALVGGGFGATGTLQNEGLETNPADLALNTGVGALTGGVVGAGLPLAIKGAGKLVTRILGKDNTLPTPEVPVQNPAIPTEIPAQSVSPIKPNNPVTFLKQKLTESDQPIISQLRNIEKSTGQTGLVDKFMYNSNVQRGSNARANVALATSDNFNQALSGLDKKSYQAFSDYANARTELSSAGDKTPLSRPRDELSAIVQSATPDQQARFAALNAHYKDLAGVARDAGIINQARYDAYTKNDNYVRLQRDMGDLLPNAFGSGKGNGYKLGSTVLSQKRTGSTRATLPVGETAADYTQQIYREAAKNTTGTNLVDNLRANGLATQLKDAAAARHENVTKIIRNGKVEYYKLAPALKEAIDNINPYQMNVVMRILSVPGRIARAGITGLNPVFIARNVFKDQASSAVNSEHLLATHNPASFFSGLWNATKDSVGMNHNPIWEDFLKHYGDITSYDLTRNAKSAKQLVNRVRGGKLTGALQAVAHPLRSLENASSITEKSTRFQQFRGEYKKAIDDGLTPEQASEKAAIAAWQNTVDFSRAGEWGRTLNMVIPYWNPATQGVRQMARTFVKHPVKSTFTATATVGLPIVAATAWNLSTSQNKQIYDNIPEYEKDNNLILIPPGTKQNTDGSYDVIKIPLPPGIKDAFMPGRRAFEAFANDKPADAAQMAGDILQTVGGPVNFQNGVSGFAGSFLPQAIKPLVQQYANHDLFSGKQIVPDYINQATDANGTPVSEAQKTYASSSGTAEQIGQALGVSPIRVEKFVKDTTGTVGLNVLNAVDTAQANAGSIPKANIGGQSVVQGLKQSFGSAQGIDNPNKSDGAKYFDNVKQVTKGLNTNEINAFNALHPASKNFLGDQIYQANSVYNPAAKLDIYNRFPQVFQADKQLDQIGRSQGQPGNPLFDLQTDQLKIVLEHDNLPPGAKDPQLSELNKQQWYKDYTVAKTNFFNQVAAEAEAQGTPLGTSKNPYPLTPAPLQKVMDTYTALPQGTGVRSSWIKANPDAWQQMQQQLAQIDDWQNKQREARGLAPTQGQAGKGAGYPSVSLASQTTTGGSSYSKRKYLLRRTYSVPVDIGKEIVKITPGTTTAPTAIKASVRSKAAVSSKGNVKPKVALKKSRA